MFLKDLTDHDLVYSSKKDHKFVTEKNSLSISCSKKHLSDFTLQQQMTCDSTSTESISPKKNKREPYK